HFLLHPGLAILRLAVRLARVKAVGLVASHRPATVKGFRQAVVAVSFAARSSPVTGCSFPVADLSGSQICPVTADLAFAAGLSAAARPDFVAAAGFSAVVG